mmetsp:Transcript_20109/g.50952  ORF Transcript_20109/g.50952 Transcript_20109/m.50952 type:complete len:278 (-) Transcript_20109:477-1310(-)
MQLHSKARGSSPFDLEEDIHAQLLDLLVRFLSLDFALARDNRAFLSVVVAAVVECRRITRFRFNAEYPNGGVTPSNCELPAKRIKIDRVDAAAQPSNSTNQAVARRAIEHLGFVGPSSPGGNQAGRSLAELCAVQHCRSGAVNNALVPRNVGNLLPGVIVPHLELVLGPPRACEDGVVINVHRVAANVRPIDASDCVFDAKIPNLHSVVPAARDHNVRVRGVELERENAVRMARGGTPNAGAHFGHERFGGLVIYAHSEVFPGGGKDGPVRTVVYAI